MSTIYWRTAALLLLIAGQAQAEQGLFRGQPVTYAIVGGQKVFEGDIVLDHVAPVPAQRGGVHTNAVGIAYPGYAWPANAKGVAQIPYVITNAATSLNDALTAFNATFTGVIQFVKRGSQADYVNFDFDPNNLSGQCESNVGMIGGEQNTGGSVSCNLGTLLHEMGHVVGLFHEQSRPDRNTYITLNFGNVIKGSESNFNQLSDNFQDLGPFDYASVMEYIPFAFSRNGGPVIDTIPAGMPLSNLTGYTAADIDGVKRLYGKTPAAVTVTSNPPGLSVMVDGAAVTTPHVFSWALRSGHRLAVPSGAQTLNGGTYIYGRWSDSTAASHSISLAPGNNMLTRPSNKPNVTVYTANFVQLSAYTSGLTPAASGSVSISPAPKSYAGASGNFLVARQPLTITATPAAGETFVTWYGVGAPYSANPKPDYAPDGGAAYAVTAGFSAMPVTTITTSPGGFYFTVDGEYFKAPQSFSADLFSGWDTGSTHTVTGFSPNQPYSVNTRYLFDNWSDGGALSHTITVPATSSTLTGTFTAQYVPIVAANPDCAATVTVSPTSPDGFYDAGTNLTVVEKPAAGWKLTGWSGDLTGKQATQTLTVSDEELATANFNIALTALKLTSLQPANFTMGTTGGTVKIIGSGFASSSAVFVNNVYRASTFVSNTEVDVALNSSDLTAAGAFPIGVSNFPSGASCGAYGALGFFVLK